MAEKVNILVVGAPRSGTTLLSGLLSAGSEASPMLPECTYITQIIDHYHKFLNYSDPQRFAAYAIDETKLTDMYKSMVSSMLTTVQSHFEGDNYRYLILKDPELTPFVDLIPKFFGSNCKITCVVRDPRAVISSMCEVESKKINTAKSALIKSPNLYTANNFVDQLFREFRLVSTFYGYYSKVHESQLYKNGDIHIVRYENIVAQDENEFKMLEDFLGFSVGRDGFGEMKFDFNRNDPTFSENYGKSIVKTKNDFRGKLSNRKIKKIEKVFSGFNEIYGWW